MKTNDTWLSWSKFLIKVGVALLGILFLSAMSGRTSLMFYTFGTAGYACICTGVIGLMLSWIVIMPASSIRERLDRAGRVSMIPTCVALTLVFYQFLKV